MKALINKLTNFIKINRLGHAYIIEGLNLEDRNDGVKIASALGITEQDVTVIMPEQSRSITVDQVRSTQDRLSRKPISGMHLVIFSPADLMNTAASNALLKLLEEPPGSSCFLLLTVNQRKLMQTIRSRSQLLSCQPPTLEGWQSHIRFSEIEAIYKHCPQLLKDDEELPLALTLYDKVLHVDASLESIYEIDADTNTLLKTAYALFSAIIIKHPEHNAWQQYESLKSLMETYQLSQNLNEKGVFDQVVILMSSVKGLTIV